MGPAATTTEQRQMHNPAVESGLESEASSRQKQRPYRASTLLESDDVISKVRLTVPEVIALCRRQVDTDRLKAPTANLCVDGTSCTKKTSILALTGRMALKTSRMAGVSNENTDSYGPSMMGHYSAGKYEVLGSLLHMHDRAPNSAHIWYVYWSLFNILRNQGNLDYFPDYVLTHVRMVFDSLRDSHIFDRITCQQFNTIALVDSDADRCDRLRTNRNCGSDVERSAWGIYTPLQNCMYQALYPGLYIDLAWFGPTDDDVVVRGVAKFLIEVQDGLVMRFGEPTGRPPFTLLGMPTAGEDLTLINMRVHMERSLGRVQHPRWPYPSDWTSDVRVPLDPMDGFVVSSQMINGICAQEWVNAAAKLKRDAAAAAESSSPTTAPEEDTEASDIADYDDDADADDDDDVDVDVDVDYHDDDRETAAAGDEQPSAKRVKVA